MSNWIPLDLSNVFHPEDITTAKPGIDADVEPSKPTDPLLMMKLESLQKQCGPLCDLEKPVLGGNKEEFLGRVTAKVIGFKDPTLGTPNVATSNVGQP